MPGTERFAHGVAGVADLLATATGNSIYAVFGLARQKAVRGTATNEFDAHNKSAAAPSTQLPPDTAPGTLQNNIIGFIVNSGGDADGSIGVYIAEGLKDDLSGNTHWAAAALYIGPHASNSKQIVIGGDSTSTGEGLVVERGGTGDHIRTKTYGTDVAGSPVIYHQNVTNSTVWSITQGGVYTCVSVVVPTVTAADGQDLNVTAPSSQFLYFGGGGTNGHWAVQTTGKLSGRSTVGIAWTADATAYGALDAGLARNGVGIVEVNNGTAGTLRDLLARVVRTAPSAVASLVAAGTAGSGARAMVSDATQTLTAGIGAIVAGGGANIVPVVSDGTNWRIG